MTVVWSLRARVASAVLAVAFAAAIVAGLLVMPPSAPVVAAPPVERSPSVVYIVIDDLSADVVPYMSEVAALADRGVSFDNFFVTDSQCCPSRASTLTGTYPHNSRVLTNNWPEGGFGRFLELHADDSMGPALSAAGFRTGFIGKFLNGYRPEGSRPNADPDSPVYPRGYVPPGWDEWHVAGAGYPSFDYTLASAVDEPVAAIERYGHEAEDYLTDVLSDATSEFLVRAAGSDEPFFLTVAPFAVHSGASSGSYNRDVSFPPAPRDRAAGSADDPPASWPDPDQPAGDCGEIVGGCDAVPYPDPADAEAFNRVPADAHRWMPNKPLSPQKLDAMHADHLDRVRMAQSVNDLIGRVRADLDRLALADDTYLVFTSDNGYHLGQHGLPQGKNTAFDTDVRVPMIVVPPGGAEPATVSAIGQNTDLLATFLDIAGQPEPELRTDGRSLLPLVENPSAAVDDWREGALIEYQFDDTPRDPDRESGVEPPTYRALRTADYLYVDYSARRKEPTEGSAELYDLVADPAATENRYSWLSPADRRKLDRALDRYASCAGVSCTAAARELPQVTVQSPGQRAPAPSPRSDYSVVGVVDLAGRP